MPFGKTKQELVRLQHQLSSTKLCPDDGTEPAVIAAIGGGHREAQSARFGLVAEILTDSRLPSDIYALDEQPGGVGAVA
jgi:hypothetical protein